MRRQLHCLLRPVAAPAAIDAADFEKADVLSNLESTRRAMLRSRLVPELAPR
jgi:hypothetical protein